MNRTEQKVDMIARTLLARSTTERSEALSKLQELMTRCGGEGTDAESMIRGILLELGMPDHIKGHAYTVCALKALLEDATLINSVTGRLYPLVAQTYGVSSVRVERAIRHAVEICLNRSALETVSDYFGNTISAMRGKPTNSEFLARISNVVRQRLYQA